MKELSTRNKQICGLSDLITNFLVKMEVSAIRLSEEDINGVIDHVSNEYYDFNGDSVEDEEEPLHELVQAIRKYALSTK